MEKQLSEILDNILGLLLLEGSYDISEDEESFRVEIITGDAGRLIGFRGETIDSLQFLVNQMLSKKTEEEFKRVIIDVSGWRKQKQEDLTQRAKSWANQVLETGQKMELEPMSSWQRRIVHMVVGEIKGVESDSVGEGKERHAVIRIKQKE